MTIHKFSISRYTFYRGHSFIDELEDNINFKLESCSVFYCQDKLHKYWAMGYSKAIGLMKYP
jgi:hypothetical protein